MRQKPIAFLECLAACAVVLVLACGQESSEPLGPSASGEAAPSFTLIDVNPNSSLHERPVSPRDYLGRVSAWYFGHAT